MRVALLVVLVGCGGHMMAADDAGEDAGLDAGREDAGEPANSYVEITYSFEGDGGCGTSRLCVSRKAFVPDDAARLANLYRDAGCYISYVSFIGLNCDHVCPMPPGTDATMCRWTPP